MYLRTSLAFPPVGAPLPGFLKHFLPARRLLAWPFAPNDAIFASSDGCLPTPSYTTTITHGMSSELLERVG